MKQENTKHLFKRFAKFFKHKSDLHQSLMGFGFAVEDGWYPLIEELLRFIEHKSKRWLEVVAIKKRLEAKGENVEKDYAWITEYFRKHPTDPFENFEVVQVKEKLGGLRCYVFGGTDEVHGAIEFAEQLSYRICEVCGGVGSLMVRNNWYKTLCEKCAENKLIGGVLKAKGGWRRLE